MATGNIDCNIPDGMCKFTPHCLNMFNPSDISECERNEICLNMQTADSPNIHNTSFIESQHAKELNSQFLNECTPYSIIDNNENCTNNEAVSSFSVSQQTMNDTSVSDKKDYDNSDFRNNFPNLTVQNVMPEELFINVESDDEGIHSWRPTMTSDPLCHDFFLAPLQDDQNLNFPSFKNDNLIQFDWTSSINDSPFMIKAESTQQQPLQSTSNNLNADIENHIHSQIVGLNNLRYEVMNERRKADTLKVEIKNLTSKLNEKLTMQRALDVGKLKEKNVQLRLECQCLCMEVDYYSKGKFPLCETDETFYKEKLKPELEAAGQNPSQSSPNPNNSDIDSQEENKKWECHKCTFANHPAINSCEMCHTQRLSSDLPFYITASSNSCYCHPKIDSS